LLDPREVLQTIDRLQTTFEDLAVRGLRSCGQEQVNILSALQEELDRIGAAHLAGRLTTLINAIRNDDRTAPAALMGAQASLRCFDRILTLESAGMQMSGAASPGAGGGGMNGDDDDDESEDDDEDEDE
jgi:hypothetical protein